MPGKLPLISNRSKGAGSSSRRPSKATSKPPKNVEEDLEAGSSDGDDDGVDEEGMAMLMKALGEDGLDDVGKMELEVLEDEDKDDTENEDGDILNGADSDGDIDQGELSDGEDEEEDLDEDEGIEASDAGVIRQGSDYGGRALDEEDEDKPEDEVALEDTESVDEDTVPRPKIVTNNKDALERIRDTIKLDPKLSWTETLAVTYSEPIEVDVEDDLTRELAFYKQALHSANTARKLAEQHKLPFTRPSDYFAEMVKSDSHMERIRQRLLDESATIKKSEDKRKEREGKKFGKQVQIEKQKERERSKKEMEERLKGLKRKNKDALDDRQTTDDAFDVAVEDAISDRPAKRQKGSGPSKISRKGRDAKFGFGGGGRRSKQNTRESTEKFEFGGRKGAGHGGKGAKAGIKPKRLGKSRRMATKGR